MSKRVFISGGSRGIGLAIAREFYRRDFEVIICARGAARLAEAKTELPQLNTLVCDMGGREQVAELVNRLNDTGPLDVLVNNAGIFRQGSLLDKEQGSFEQMMQVNLFGAFYLTRGVLPAMLQQKRGTIINIGSIAGRKAYSSSSLYSISKFAFDGFTQNLREELKPHGIRVINVMPGATWTDSWGGVELPEERFMPVEDIGKIVFDAYSLSGRTVIEEIVARPQLGDV